MRQNQCLINVSHLHCKCTVNSSMLLAFFVSMEILWLCLLSHLLSVGLRVLPSASEDRSRWTPRASSGRPQPVGLIHAIDTLNTQTVEFPHHSHQSTNILIIRAIDFVFLIATPITSPVSRIFHSTGENYFFLDFFHPLSGTYTITLVLPFADFFHLSRQVTSKCPILLRPETKCQSLGRLRAFLPQVLFNRRNLPLPLEMDNTKKQTIILWICQIQL